MNSNISWRPKCDLYLNAKYLHAIGQNRVTWRWQIRTVAWRATVPAGSSKVNCCPRDLAIMKSSNDFVSMFMFWFWGITKQIVSGVIDSHENICFQSDCKTLTSFFYLATTFYKLHGKNADVDLGASHYLYNTNQELFHIFIYHIVLITDVRDTANVDLVTSYDMSFAKPRDLGSWHWSSDRNIKRMP